HRLRSYMPCNIFALALLDILGSRGVGESWQDIIKQRQKELKEAQDKLAANPGDTGLQKAVVKAQAALDKVNQDAQKAADAKDKHDEAANAAKEERELKDHEKLPDTSK